MAVTFHLCPSILDIFFLLIPFFSPLFAPLRKSACLKKQRGSANAVARLYGPEMGREALTMFCGGAGREAKNVALSQLSPSHRFNFSSVKVVYLIF